MFIWGVCCKCGAQCGSDSKWNAPQTVLKEKSTGRVIVNMQKEAEDEDKPILRCTAWTTFYGPPDDPCYNCTRTAEHHHGREQFCFPYFLFKMCCECCESEGHVGSIFFEHYGCEFCKDKITQRLLEKERQKALAAERMRRQVEMEAARQMLLERAEAERKARDAAAKAAREQALRERAEREREQFEPLNWLRGYLDDVCPRPEAPAPPPPHMHTPPFQRVDDSRVGNRGVAETWWGWQPHGGY